MYVLVAEIKAKVGKEEELEKILAAMIPDVQNEEGTVAYALNRSKSEPRKYMFYEKYKDEEAFKLHASTSYFKTLQNRLTEDIVEERTREFYEEVTAITR